jgi:TolA-binding protein
MKRTLLAVSVAALGLTGCLKTRTDVREGEQKQVIAQEVTKLQRTNADVSGRFADVEEEMRALRGRVEVIEHRSGQSSQENDAVKKYASDQSADSNKKIQLLQEGLSGMEKTVFQLNAELNAMKAERAAMIAQASASQAKAATEAKKSSYESGQDYFEDKDWKKAILQFQKYRDENPKGAKFTDATYKMGVCFQEIGMKDEAKTFYDELISKFPSSSEAKKAKTRLKGLKK